MKQLSSFLCRLLTLLPLLAPAAGAAQAPALTSVSPGSGPLGSTLTLTGTGLTGLQSVLVGGVPAASFAVQSATQATAVVPRQAVSQRVRVSSPTGTTLSAVAFQVTRPSPGDVFPGLGNLTTDGRTALNVGLGAVPTVTDVDGDGLLDLLVGTFTGTVRRYEQTTTNGNAFVLRDILSADGSTSLNAGSNAAPTVTDVDGDGLLDLLVGNGAGNVLRYEQTTANGGVFASQGNLSADGSTALDVGSNAVLTVTDVDGDGLLDLLVGNANGNVLRYEQTTANGGVFASQGNLTIDGSTDLYVVYAAAPTVTDVDGDGLLDLLVGNSDGNVRRYEQTTANGGVFGGLGNLTTDGNTPLNAGLVASPTVTDIDGDGLLDLLVSNSDGNVLRYEQTIITGFTPAVGTVGSTISLTGTNLTGATAITFSGSGANVVTTGFTVESATSITGVVVPEGAATGPLTVTTGAGTSAPSAASFTVCSVVARGQNASQALSAGGTATFAASTFDNGSTSTCSSALQPTLRKGGLAFGRVAENGTLTLTAPAGYTFTAVDFASYGSPSSSSGGGDYAFGACHAATSRRVVEAALLGQTGTVSIPATSANFGGDPCGGTPKFLAVRALYTRSPAGSVVFGSVTEGSSLTLTAPAGTVFTGVSFASYGTPTGTGGTYVAGSCESANSRRVVEAALLGQSGTVLIPATNDNFGGDPCDGTPKTLAVRATYAPGGPTLVFDCTELGAQPVLLTLTDAAGARATTAVTATVSVPAQATTSWTGSRSTDWADCANWSYGLVPTASLSATLPASLPRYPSLPSGTYLVQDLTIASGASLSTTSGATLQVSGDWLNNSAAVTVGGDVVFAGTTAQIIGGTAGTAFATVVVSKPGGTLTLGHDLAIGTRLALTSGTLLTTGRYRVALGSAATLDETDAAYVTGAVEATRPLDTAGSGSSFGGLGLTLTPAAGSAALPGSTLVRRTTGTPATGVGTSGGIGRYFDIQPTVDTGLDVSLVFSYFEHELNNIPEANLRLFKSTGTAAGPWALQTPSTADATANTVTKTGITDFSVWTLGTSAAPCRWS
jgi:hypothetical protein